VRDPERSKKYQLDFRKARLYSMTRHRESCKINQGIPIRNPVQKYDSAEALEHCKAHNVSKNMETK